MGAWSKGMTLVGLVLAVGCGGEVVIVPEPVRVIDPPPPDLQNDGDQREGEDRREDQAEKKPELKATGPLAPNTCVALMAGSSGEHIARIDLATGQVVQGPRVLHDGKPLYGERSAVGVVGASLWKCDNVPGPSSGVVMKVSLDTGVVTPFTNVTCHEVTASKDGIFVLKLTGDVEKIERYVDEAAVLAGAPAETLDTSGVRVLGPASGGGIVTSAYRGSPVTRPSGPVTLEGYDDHFLGISEAGGRILVSSPTTAFGGTHGLEAFDSSTGKPLGQVARFPGFDAAGGFRGLACAD